MLVAAAVLPHPPVLVPEVGVGDTAWLSELRAACLAAVRDVLATGCDEVVVVGAGRRDLTGDERSGGSMAPYGVPVRYGGPDGDLSLALTVAAYLLDAAGWQGPRRYHELDAARALDERLALGAEVAGRPERTVLLAMGDGSARRSTEAPGYLDERAEPFDRTVVEAVRAGDREMLRQLDPRLAEELWVAGVPAWQVLAGACGGSELDATVRYDAAPAGVGYFVIVLEPRRTEVG